MQSLLKMSLIKAIQDTNVEQWVSSNPQKLTLNQVCLKFGIDIENDPVNKIFWNIGLTRKIVINEDMLDYMGYSGPFNIKNNSFRRLLYKNIQIDYYEVADTRDIRKKYVVLDGIDFEALLMQMRTPKADELRTLFSLMKMSMTKYCEYEKQYAIHLTEICRWQTNVVLEKLDRVGLKLEFEMERAACERREIEQKAASERQRAEEERQRADEERHRAEEERQLAEEERQRAECRAHRIQKQLERNVNILQDTIAPNLTPPPISSKKMRLLGIFTTGVPGEWYLMRRQKEGWKDAERKLLKRGMSPLHRWENVPHAIDMGNLIKRYCCKTLSWNARGNKIRAKTDLKKITNSYVLETLTSMLRGKNIATQLAIENQQLFD